MGFFKTVLWIAAAVLLIVIVFVAVSVLRRSEFANGSLLAGAETRSDTARTSEFRRKSTSPETARRARPTSAGDPRARQNGYAQNGMRQNTSPRVRDSLAKCRIRSTLRIPGCAVSSSTAPIPGTRESAIRAAFSVTPEYRISAESAVHRSGGNVPSGNPYGQINHRNGDVRRTQGNHGGANTAGRQYPDGSQDGRQ